MASATLACSSQHKEDSNIGAIGLHLTAPKGLLDVEQVQLVAYDQRDVRCADNQLQGNVPTTMLLDLKLSRCENKWCGTADMPIDDAKILTWYVKGSKAGLASFGGCVEKAVNQNPLQVDIKIDPIFEGAVCGDSVLRAPETCDPGPNGENETCDVTACKTKEVIVSNGQTAMHYYRGLAGRKKGLSMRWIRDSSINDDRFMTAWSDVSVGANGGDGPAEVTIRQLNDDLTSIRIPSALRSELRLQTKAMFSTDGQKRRPDIYANPTFAPVENGNLLFVFTRTLSTGESHIYGSLQTPQLSAALSDDFILSANLGNQTQPAIVAGTRGDSLIAFLDGGLVKSVLRRGTGTLGTIQPLTNIGENTTPRVAFVGGGEYVVVWSDNNDIWMRRLNGDGLPKDPSPVLVNVVRRSGIQDQPNIIGLSSGRFAIVWRERLQANLNGTIHIQKFNVGIPTGNEWALPVNDLTANNDAAMPAIASGKTSQGQEFYLVTWANVTNGQIAARFVDAENEGYLFNSITLRKSEFDVGVASARVRTQPAVAVNAAFCAIGWVDDTEANANADDDRVRVRKIPLPLVF